MDAQKPDGYTDGIPAATVLVSETYAQNLFESCNEVRYLFLLKSMNLMCGSSDCNVNKWLNYMGTINNGRAPMPISFILSDTNWQAPDGTILEPLNIPTARCDQPLTRSSNKIGTTLCNKIIYYKMSLQCELLTLTICETGWSRG